MRFSVRAHTSSDPVPISSDPPRRFLEWFLGRIELQLLGPAGSLDDAIAAAAAAGAAQVSAPSLEAPGAFVGLSRERAEAAAALRKAEQLVFDSVRVRVLSLPCRGGRIEIPLHRRSWFIFWAGVYQLAGLSKLSHPLGASVFSPHPQALLKKEPQPVDRSIVSAALQSAGGGTIMGAVGGVFRA